jgi:hypothetical protein
MTHTAVESGVEDISHVSTPAKHIYFQYVIEFGAGEPFLRARAIEGERVER